MYRDRSGRMPIKSGRVPTGISIKRPGSAVPLQMGVCCIEIGDEMEPLKRVGLPLLIHGMTGFAEIFTPRQLFGKHALGMVWRHGGMAISAREEPPSFPIDGGGTPFATQSWLLSSPSPWLRLFCSARELAACW